MGIALLFEMTISGHPIVVLASSVRNRHASSQNRNAHPAYGFLLPPIPFIKKENRTNGFTCKSAVCRLIKLEYTSIQQRNLHKTWMACIKRLQL
jgi:hypothetical protein